MPKRSRTGESIVDLGQRESSVTCSQDQTYLAQRDLLGRIIIYSRVRPSNTAACAYAIGPQKRSRPQHFSSEASAAAAVASWPLASLRMCDCAERGIGEGFAVLALCDAGMIVLCTTSKGRKDPQIFYTARS